MTTIKKGSKGDDVKIWQRFLAGKKYNITIDGVFGPKTESATKEYQKKNGYDITGIVGDTLWLVVDKLIPIVWGKRVTKPFINKVFEISNILDVEPNWLMACMAFESGKTFSPSIRNAAGSGATGLIQFMPQTAAALGTTTDKLSKMSAVSQLEYVLRYFEPSAGRLKNLEDVYMAILWPAGVGKSLNYVLFDKADVKYPKRYVQNAGLDIDRNGKVTKGEAANKVRQTLTAGFAEKEVLLINPDTWS